LLSGVLAQGSHALPPMFRSLFAVCLAILLVEGVAPLSEGPRLPWDRLPSLDFASAQDPIGSRTVPSAEHHEAAQSETLLRVLTYNVAGLPSWLSQARPDRDSATIGARLAPFDIVLLQEDFSYHEEIAAAAAHPHASAPRRGRLRFFGDGLGRFSKLPMGLRHRVSWSSCHGVLGSYSDCLARKGCSIAVHRVLGEKLYVVNLHLDAGRAGADRSARQRQLDQLCDELARLPAGAALVVAGDFNLEMQEPLDRALYRDLLRRTGLSDAVHSLGVEDEHIDRIAYRSGARLEISVLSAGQAQGFEHANGVPLSDHPAIQAELHICRVRGQAAPRAAAQLNSPRMYSLVRSSLGFSKSSCVSPSSTR
jgi:endonuclease/exonuclease/phosphatase family metal-dependent hydrolase